MLATPQRQMLSPQEPPIQTLDLPAPGGHLGERPEDFCVDEVPLYARSGTGAHLYVRLRKRDWTTQDAVVAVARAAGVAPRDVGFAGMKDRRAVTTQWLSLPLRDAAPLDRWKLPAGLEILESGIHGNKLRTGHLLGNEFRIRIVDVDDDALGRAEAIAERLRSRGLVNYFGAQRFGRNGRNLEQALHWLREDERSKRKGGRFQQKLFPSVIQAEVFNRYATARCAIGTDRLLTGEVVRLEGTGSFFVVTDAEENLPRLLSGDVHLTGPIIGPKTREAAAEALALERRVAEETSLSTADIERLGKFAGGTRRDLVIRPQALRLTKEPNALSLEFFLPAGSYATQLIRELTRAPFIEPHAGRIVAGSDT